MFLPNTRIEIINSRLDQDAIHCALFDFDGTLSLVREGWPEVMIPMMVKLLEATGTDESSRQLRDSVEEFVMRLNGRQTIYQMIQLVDEIVLRGGHPKDPLHYKQQYNELLWKRIEHRVTGLLDGSIPIQRMTVPGSHDLLDALQKRGVRLYLASGTDISFVRNEASAIRVTEFFGEHLYGALDDYEQFSKQMVINQLIESNAISGRNLVGFGDGYVEIEEIKRVGGIAIGVASDEAHQSGINEWKRQRLIKAGADVIIPDYRDLEPLIHYLFEPEP